MMGVAKTVKTGAQKAAEATSKTGYSPISSFGRNQANLFLDEISEGLGKGYTSGFRIGLTGRWAHANSQEAAYAAGYSSILGLAGSHAIRGAAWGAVSGGTIEALQGGSFWDGAKQGAFNGAAGWTAYRMGMHAVGSTRNPLNVVGSLKDIYKGGLNMWRATGGADVNVSKQAVQILNQRQRDGLARAIMNMENKANAR